MIFEFEELIADMFDISDDEINKDGGEILYETFMNEFGISVEDAHPLIERLLDHVPVIQTGLTGTKYRAFVSKNKPIMLIRKEVDEGDKS